VSDLPPYDELADDEDELDWSWDALTGGERDILTDQDVDMVVLFAGVPEDEVDEHRRKLTELLEGD
jgi:hypothetical protein